MESFSLPRKGVSKFKGCFICITILVIIHISNIYKDKELDIISICAENAQVQIEKNRKVNHATFERSVEISTRL